MITPLDIQQKEFQVSRFGGYRMRDVDEFLDQLTDAMTALLAENERLRSGADASPIVGSPDLDEVSRQADEIIQRARDEAARVVAEANERSAAGIGDVTDADRAAVDAFLARERGFLQSLASLVQEHADGVKGMAREVRRRGGAVGTGPASATSDDAARPAAPGSPAPAAVAPPEAPPPTTEPASSATTRAAEPEPTRPIEPAAPVEREEPIVVSEPEPAATRREDGDESLRELFWGEEN
jgi:DivIVA domain-containing protein